jgi:DNA-binding NarL/FixJ family response regulator
MHIVIADDQPQVRSALRLLIEQEPGVTVVGDAGTAPLLLAQVERLHPDLVLMDWELPGLPADEVLAILRDCYPQTMVVALSGRLGARQAALTAGVDAFVSKGEPAERVMDALHAMACGAVSSKGCDPDDSHC